MRKHKQQDNNNAFTSNKQQPHYYLGCCQTNFCEISHPPGIDKITEKAQVSQDGTMVAVPRSESQARASDTESNSERDGEVTAPLPLPRPPAPPSGGRRESITLSNDSLLTSGPPGGVRGSQESLGQRLVNSRSLERRSRLGQLASALLVPVLCVRVSECCERAVLLSPGVVLEDQASPADHHATAAGAGASGGEDLY